MLIQDTLEVFAYRRITHRTLDLNPTASPFELQKTDIKVEETQEAKDVITTARKILQPM